MTRQAAPFRPLEESFVELSALPAAERRKFVAAALRRHRGEVLGITLLAIVTTCAGWAAMAWGWHAAEGLSSAGTERGPMLSLMVLTGALVAGPLLGLLVRDRGLKRVVRRAIDEAVCPVCGRWGGDGAAAPRCTCSTKQVK